jgi:putative endonuclease
MRTTNHRRGILAEYAALVYLTAKGYRLVALRYKTKMGEIDLIMRRGRTLAFIEVKARTNHSDAAHAIHPKNQQRVMQAAQLFLIQHPMYHEYEVRFDALLIAWYRWPHHLVHAFGADG